MTAAEILQKAADVIDQRGWHQGDAYDHSALRTGTTLDACPVCTLGAINVVVNGDPAGWGVHGGIADQAAQAFAAHLGMATNFDPNSEHSVTGVVGNWNDAPGRTATEVTTALRECAAELAGTAR
jgi:hypothetical protein